MRNPNKKLPRHKTKTGVLSPSLAAWLMRWILVCGAFCWRCAMINWKKLNKKDCMTISAIVKRAVKMVMVKDVVTTNMDISAAHIARPLDLDALLVAAPGDFGHDVNGILYNIDRGTGELENCFVPRFAR